MSLLSRSRSINRFGSSCHPNIICRLQSEKACSEATAEENKILDSKHFMKTVNINSQNFEEIFCYDLPEGRCLGLKVDECKLTDGEGWEYSWLNNYLHQDEIAYGLQMSHKNTRSFNPFYLGRLALRQAFRGYNRNHKDILSAPILKDEFGRPLLPHGLSGSISHKNNIAVALVADKNHFENSSVFNGIGVDIEYITASTRIGRKVLTPNEQRSLGNLSGLSEVEEVLLRFR